MGATAPALLSPVCTSKSFGIPGRNGGGESARDSFDGNERLLSCRNSSSSSSKVTCGGVTGNRGGRKSVISSGLWGIRASVGVSSFTGTGLHEIQCKVWDFEAVSKRSELQRGVRMMWGGGKLEAPKPSVIPLEQINGEDEFNKVLEEAKERGEPVIIDWLATWCRKCIYLKPKLEKLAVEYHPNLKFYCVDVNTVPQALVKRANVTKMPTIQLWKDGEHVGEVIGGHQAWLVMDEVREMIQLKK